MTNSNEINMEKFNQFKSEILKRAKEVSACVTLYQRAYKSENFDQLFQIIKDNYFYCCNNKIIDPVFSRLRTTNK